MQKAVKSFSGAESGSGKEGHDEEERPSLCLDKGESVYAFALYIPPIQKHKHGHWKTWDMCLGGILLFTNMLMQIGLTYVVGQGVIYDGNEWRFTLVRVDPDDQVAEGQVSKDLDQMSFLGLPDHAKYHSLSDTARHIGYHEKAYRPKRNMYRINGQDHPGDLVVQSFVEESSLVDTSKPPRKGAGQASTLCTMKNATYNCLPPSARYANEWKHLDTNGDGIWTREEAEKDEAGFEKKFKAKAFLVFRAITVGLTDRGSMDPNLWVSDEVKEMRAIPKPYFDYWMGDAAICSYADPKVCGTLLDRGYFAEAFHKDHHGKNIPDIDGALDYCVWMLSIGGGCDQTLPQIYKLFRALRHEQCGDSSLYNGGLYKNPHHEVDRVYVTAVDYDGLSKHMKADEPTYKFFLFLVLQLWFMALLNEMRELLKLGEFCVVFPAAGEDGGLEVEKSEDGESETYKITGLEPAHRQAVVLVVILRVILVIYLGVVGCIFLIMETGYMDLLMNAVALAFILEIDEILFGAIARATTSEELEAVAELEFFTTLPDSGCAGWVLHKDFWGIIMFPIIAIAIMMSFSLFVTKPNLDALNCGCYQKGSQCHEAQLYNKEWWDNYWSTILPSAMTEIQKFKEAAGF
jgi:hypothetical protein